MSKEAIKNNLVLELHVEDFRPARSFYRILGFEEQAYDPATAHMLGYELGDTMLNSYGDRPAVTEQTHFRNFPTDTPRGYAVEVTIPVTDAARLWMRAAPLLDSGVTVQQLQARPWGAQDFRLVDPYGFYLRFTELADWGQ